MWEKIGYVPIVLFVLWFLVLMVSGWMKRILESQRRIERGFQSSIQMLERSVAMLWEDLGALKEEIVKRESSTVESSKPQTRTGYLEFDP